MVNISIDKYKHILISAIIVIILKYLMPIDAAIVITLFIGIIKELYDKYTGKGNSEWKDIIADIIGIAIGVL